MPLNFVSIFFFVVGCIAYAMEISNRAHTGGLTDARMDVVCIALLGLVAHFAFERRPVPSQSDHLSDC